MKLFLLILSTIGLTVHAGPTNPKCQHSNKAFNCVIFIDNYDGDTITVDIPRVHQLLGKKISVRILGVDTPEMKSKVECERELAVKARDFIHNTLIISERIDLTNIGRDKYFRIDADVIVDGKSLGKLLIDNKLAVSYDGGTKLGGFLCPSSSVTLPDFRN